METRRQLILPRPTAGMYLTSPLRRALSVPAKPFICRARLAAEAVYSRKAVSASVPECTRAAEAQPNPRTPSFPWACACGGDVPIARTTPCLNTGSTGTRTPPIARSTLALSRRLHSPLASPRARARTRTRRAA